MLGLSYTLPYVGKYRTRGRGLSPELAATVVEALKENPSLSSAAAKVGVTASTLSKWIRLGEDGDERYQDFAVDCHEARRMLKDEVVEALKQTALDNLHPQQTKAAHMLLSNLYEDEFNTARRQSIELKKSDDAETFDMSVLETDELRELNRIVKKLKAANAPKPTRYEHNPPVLELKPDGEDSATN